MKAKLLIIVLAASTGLGQAQMGQKLPSTPAAPAAPGAPAKPKTAPTKSDVMVTAPTTHPTTGLGPMIAPRPPIDVTGGALLSKWVKFTYQPSDRDPFISSSVVSPFVTETDLPEMLVPDQEALYRARSQIEDYITDNIEIQGVSTEERVSGYAVGNGGQILRPGRPLLVPVDTKAIEVLKTRLLKEGLSLGVEINGKITEPLTEPLTEKKDLLLKTRIIPGGYAYILETLRIEIQGEEKVVVFLSPLEINGEDRSEITKRFEGIKGVYQVGEIPIEPQ